MKNMIKVVAIAALLSSVAHVNAKTEPLISVKSIVNGANRLHPWFPGTWPLNKVMQPQVESLAQELGIKPENLPKCLFDQDTGVFGGKRELAPWVQLSFAASCKWLPVAAVVTFVAKKLLKKKHKKHAKHHDAHGEGVILS